MASTQQVPAEVAAKMTDEQKAEFEEMVKEVQSSDSVNGNNSQVLAMTHVTLGYSFRINEAKFFDNHDYSGKVVGEYPKVLAKGQGVVKFVHSANVVGGNSKAGVAYSDGTWYWLLAWNEQSNQVLVKYEKEAPIDWTAIETELNASSNRSYASHPVLTVIRAMATIANGKVSAKFND